MNRVEAVRTLQERISQMQPLRLGDDALPTPAQLRPLFPGGALRKGSAVQVQGSLQLSLAMLSAASASGAWCGVIGVRGLGFEAAAQLGIALERFIVIPDPGRHALSIAGTLSETLAVVLLHPPERTQPGDIERLAARLRDHGTALIALGPWPRAESRLRVTASRWSGLGQGHGMLDAHEIVVRSEDRRGPRQHTVRFQSGRLARPAVQVGAS